MLIITPLLVWAEGHREPHYELFSQSRAWHISEIRTTTFWFCDWRDISLCLLKTCNLQPNLIDLLLKSMIIKNEQFLFTTINENEASADIYFLLTSTQTCKNTLVLLMQGPLYSQETWKLDKWPHFFIYFFWAPSVCDIDLCFKIFKINFCVVHSDL